MVSTGSSIKTVEALWALMGKIQVRLWWRENAFSMPQIKEEHSTSNAQKGPKAQLNLAERVIGGRGGGGHKSSGVSHMLKAWQAKNNKIRVWGKGARKCSMCCLQSKQKRAGQRVN